MWGNDYSIYITVEVDPVSLSTKLGISDVLEVYTGLDDVDISILDADHNGLKGGIYDQNKYGDNAINNGYDGKTDGNKGDRSSVYIVYDDEDSVIGAIILGEDTRSSNDYAYILEDTQVEWKDGGSTYWEITAIVAGEVETLTIKSPTRSFKTLQADILKQLEIDESGMMELTYDEDGYVIDAVHVEDDTGVDTPVYDNGDFGDVMDPDDFDVYDMEWGAGLTGTNGTANFDKESHGRTLAGKSGDRGIRIDTNQYVYVVWREYSENAKEYDTVYRRFTDMDAAINALEKEGNFTGWVSGVLNDRGNAEYLVIKDPEVHSINDNDGEGNSNGRLRLNSLGIDGGKLTVNVTNLSDTTISIHNNAIVTIQVTNERNTQLYYAEDVAISSLTANGTGISDGDSKDLSFTYNGVNAAAGDYTVTVTIEDDNDVEWSATTKLALG